ncbi:MerR family transcriptional regulator [Streptomyces sp. NPDC054783]
MTRSSGGRYEKGAAGMLIGVLSARTGTSPRLLRHYEHTGLLIPHRRANGYREYTEADIPRVRRIRTLLAAGLPTRVVAALLPCTADNTTPGPTLAPAPASRKPCAAAWPNSTTGPHAWRPSEPNCGDSSQS